MPAIMLTLALCVGAVYAVGQQIYAAQCAAHSARLIGRGDPLPPISSGQFRDVEFEGKTVCVRITVIVAFGNFNSTGLRVSARGCALNESLNN